MTIISGPVKSVDYHPDVSEAIAAYSASVIDFFEARRQLSSESERTAKGAEKELGRRKAVGILCLLESATPQTAGTDQLRLAAGGVPSQRSQVTFGQAIQALSVRH
jgi:hypothetical protein